MHLITNLIILSVCLHGCASTSLDTDYDFKNIASERKKSLLSHYNVVARQYLVQSHFYSLSSSETNYINSLILKNDKIGFRKVSVIFNETPFYFVTPGRTLLFSSGFLKNHLHNEQLLKVFLVENLLRIRNNFFGRKVIYPNGAITPQDLTNIMNLSLKTKDELNNLCIEEMIEKRQNPLSLLNYIQQRNKDAFLLSNVINGSVYGLEEERHLKTYLLEKHKSLFLADVVLETSSNKFYRLKKAVLGKIKND